MKAIHLIAFFLFAANVNGQTTDSALSYIQVVEVPEVSKDELFKRAKNWFATTFNNSNYVLKNTDPEAGELLGTAAFQYNTGNTMNATSLTINGWIRYRIKVNVKDGKYRYEITQFTHTGSPVYHGLENAPFNIGLITTSKFFPDGLKNSWHSKAYWEDTWGDIKYECKEEAKRLIATLQVEMKKPSVGSTDW